jgi:protein SCO1/2
MSEQALRGRRRLRWEWLAVAVVAAVILGVVAFATFQPIKVLPRIRLAPGFLLTDQAGLRLTNEDLRGKIALYNFGYAHCGAQCEPLNATMRTVQDQLAQAAGAGVPVELVTISFDPERDTPEALQAYARAAGADPSRWRFATGDPARMKNIIGGGFEAYYEPDDQGGFKFSPAFALVDGWGIIRAEYRNEVPTPERVLKHIEVIQEEARNSKGVAKMGYEAAHLFLCYAR